jgi:hypothetical protein
MHWLAGLHKGAEPPRPLHDNSPFHDAVAAGAARGLTGAVLLAVDIDEHGRVTRCIAVARGRDDEHRRAAEAAGTLLRFSPATHQGKAVGFEGLRFGVTFGGVIDMRRRRH